VEERVRATCIAMSQALTTDASQSSSPQSTSFSSSFNPVPPFLYGSTRTSACALRASSEYAPAHTTPHVAPLSNTVKGFDEFMNLVIDDAVEVTLAKKDAPEERRKVGQYNASACQSALLTCPGQILLKGDNISLIQQLQ
jgi:small nuclear ribonucleoprotein (snRNP)-like protein